MKRSRMGIKRNRKKSTLILVIIFCVILPAIAIYTGLKITERVMLPALNDNDELPEDIVLIDDNPQEEVDTNVSTEKKLTKAEIKPLSIYTIQVASLNDTVNVEKLINMMNDQKLSNLVYKIDNTFKVYTMAATQRSIIEENITKIKELYPDAYISETLIPSRTIEFDGNSQEAQTEKITAGINELIDTMDNLSIEWNNLYQKKGERGKYVELLKKQQVILAQLSKDVNEGILPNSFQRKNNIIKMIEFQQANVSRALEYLEGSKEDLDFRIHSLYLDSLFRIVEVIK